MEHKTNPVIWFEIYVDDMSRARKFYETVLSVTLQNLTTDKSDMMDYFMFPWEEKAAGSSGALVKMKEVSPGGNGTMVYFASEDCEKEQNRVSAAGGEVLKPKFPIGEHGFISICRDTEGNVFGLHSMK